VAVTFTADCFDPNAPTDPDWDDTDDDFDPSRLTGHHKGGWEADPRFRVVTDTVERAADALLVVADRFMRVGESGTEYPPGSTDPGSDYTPNSSDVSVDNDAAYVWADTKGGLTHEMAATMKRILVEELARVDVSAMISEDYRPVRGSGAQGWPRRRE
jgi:hypothetical protein